MKKTPLRNKLFTNLFVLPIVLSFIGVIFIFEASSVRSFSEFGDSFHYLKAQLVWVLLGISAMFVFALFDYHNLYYLAFFFMLGTILLLIVVLIPGIGHKVGGARRWVDLGFFNIQPTELAKFSVIIYLSSWFIHRERRRFFSFLVLMGVLMILIILQPDMGTGLIVFLLSIAIYYLAGIDLIYLFFLIPISAMGFYLLIKIAPYRLNRLMAFFDPSRDPLGITYHINQIMISLTNGGFFGRGLGASRQKYLFLPEAHTDSIFAIIAEEFGFIGGIVLIFIFILIGYSMYWVAVNAKDRYGKLLAGGIFVFFNLQSIINLSAMVNLIPLTGVPLPFLSYGGSNLLVSFSLIGILVSIAKKIKKT